MLKIKQIRELKNITQDEMVAETGIPKRSYVDYENEKQDISLERLRKIATFLNVSISALVGETNSEENLTISNGKEKGKESGKKQNVNKTLPNEGILVNEHQPVYNEKRQSGFKALGVPLIPIDAMAGFGTGSTQVMDYDTKMYVVPEFTELKVDFMIPVKGSSMYPKYNSGDLVACKKLNIKDLFFQWNKVYVLDTEQGALIKRIKKAADSDHILLVSDNKSYDPFEIHLSKVYAVALVVGVIRLE